MPSLEFDSQLTRAYDHARSEARIWQLRAEMAREHTADLIDENRQWKREARSLLECTQRLTRHSHLLRAPAARAVIT